MLLKLNSLPNDQEYCYGGKALGLAKLCHKFKKYVPAGFVVVGNEESDLSALVEPQKYYAVRSSAVGEDGAEHSFAGQFETILGVQGEADIKAAIQTCRQSLQSTQAMAYQTTARKELDTMAVIVQEMVRAHQAGVMFTLNPTTNSPEEIVINASYGLGDLVVAGEVTPDTFIVSKESGDIESIIGSKKQMSVMTPNGVEVIATDTTLAAEPCLIPTLVSALAKLGKDIETEFGEPMDIEWALVKDQIYLLQARPITTGKKP